MPHNRSSIRSPEQSASFVRGGRRRLSGFRIVPSFGAGGGGDYQEIPAIRAHKTPRAGLMDGMRIRGGA
jgi:hypothetical protein